MQSERNITVKLKELRDADVHFVSLVDRAASRIPFRVTKQENDMGIDLSSFQRTMKRDTTTKNDTPAVQAVVVEFRDDAYQTQVQTVLKANGFAVDKVTKNDDGTVMYAQAEGSVDEGQIVRVSQDMLVVAKGFDSAKLSEATGFSPDVAVEGYFPGMDIAVAGMGKALNTGLVAKADVQKTVQLFGQYVQGLATLPAPVFKADAEIQALTPAKKGDILDIEALLKAAPMGSDGTDWAKMSTVDKISWMLQSFTTKADGCPKGMNPFEWNKMTPEEKAAAQAKDNDPDDAKKAELAAAAAKAAKNDAPDVTATITAALAAALAPVTDGMKVMTSKLEAQQTAIDEIARKSETAIKAVKGTVAAAPLAGDLPGEGHQVQKQDSDPRTGCFDTAFIGRAQKRDRATCR